MSSIFYNKSSYPSKINLISCLLKDKEFALYHNFLESQHREYSSLNSLLLTSKL